MATCLVLFFLSLFLYNGKVFLRTRGFLPPPRYHILSRRCSEMKTQTQNCPSLRQALATIPPPTRYVHQHCKLGLGGSTMASCYPFLSRTDARNEMRVAEWRRRRRRICSFLNDSKVVYRPIYQRTGLHCSKQCQSPSSPTTHLPSLTAQDARDNWIVSR